MRISASILVAAEAKTVWATLTDATRRCSWQAHVENVDAISGTPGESGCVCKLSFSPDSGSEPALETLTEARCPDFVAFLVEDGRSSKVMVHTLESRDNGVTQWTVWSNTSFNGLAKLGALFQRSTLQTALDNDMQRFKLMVETDEAQGQR